MKLPGLKFLRGAGIARSLAVALLLVAPSLWAASPKLNVVFAQPLPLPAYSFLYVGQYLGTFAEEGIDVEYTWATSSTLGIQQLAAGNADVFVGAYDSILVSAARGKDLGLQAFFSYQRGNQVGVVVPVDSPVKQLKDLEHKVVGVPQLTAAFTVNTLKLGVKLNGGDPELVDLVAVGVGLEAANALTSGRVAAIAQVDTSIAQIRNTGVKLRELPNPTDLATISAMMTSKRSFIDSNAALIEKYARAIVKGNIFFTENPKAAVQIAWKLYPEIKPKGISDADALTQGVNLIVARAAHQSLSGGDIPVWGAVSDREWANFLRFLDVEPAKLQNREQYLTSRFLKNANNFDEAAYAAWARAYVFGGNNPPPPK